MHGLHSCCCYAPNQVTKQAKIPCFIACSSLPLATGRSPQMQEVLEDRTHLGAGRSSDGSGNQDAPEQLQPLLRGAWLVSFRISVMAKVECLRSGDMIWPG